MTTLEGGFGVVRLDPDRLAKCEAHIAEKAAQGSHVLAITEEDGEGEVWTHSSTQPGLAADAHADLARRWKEAHYKFDRDRAALRLTRTSVDGRVLTVVHAEVSA